MTLLIGVDASTHRQPKNSNIVIEPGIIMASDTRVTYLNGVLPPSDDQLKVVFLTPSVAGGFAGDIATARDAFRKVKDVFRGIENPAPSEVAEASQTALTESVHDLDARGVARSNELHVLIGGLDNGLGQFRMFLLSNQHGFEPIRKKGLYAVGDGWEDFVGRYVDVLDHARGTPRDPWRHPEMSLKGLSDWITEMLDLKIKDAAETAQTLGTSALVGGFVRLVALRRDERFEVVGTQVSEDGGQSYKLNLNPVDELLF